MDIRTYLKNSILLFDGAMGTYCSEVIPESIGTPCELLNLSMPEEISKIHKAYIKSGAKAIKTNTFSANRITMNEKQCIEVIRSGWEIASRYSDSAYIFADIGPIAVTDSEDLFREYKFITDIFLSCSANCFLFETNSSIEAIAETASYIKAKNPDAFIIVSFASLPDGFTRTGQVTEKLIEACAKIKSIDAVGLNCASGAGHMARLIESIKIPDKYFSAMPNAGYPTVLGNRTFYDGSPAFFAEQIQRMITVGVKILGGCCGTTPEHIKAASKVIKLPSQAVKKIPNSYIKKEIKTNKFWVELCNPDKHPFAVELDPPESSDISKFIEGAKLLKENGASVITIADCPIGRPRMDSSLLACKLKRELDTDVLPHMTCRDRNLNATKALLLGLCAEDVHNVLIVTGDPVPTADRDEVKSVYNFNSRMLAVYISALAEKSLTTPFHIFAALNVNAHNFDIQLRIACEKEKNGVCGFLTQPILTDEAFENLKKARKVLHGKIAGGIFPIVSYKNACFLNSEVSGVKVSEKIISLYKNKTREEAEELAFNIALKTAQAISPFTDGFYLMTPFSRTELISRIMNGIRALDL